MRELTEEEVGEVSGGLNDLQNGGIAIMAIGFSGGPTTGAIGLVIGGGLLFIGSFIIAD